MLTVNINVYKMSWDQLLEYFERLEATFLELGNKRTEEQAQALPRAPQPTSREEEQKKGKDVLDVQEVGTHQRRVLVEP